MTSNRIRRGRKSQELVAEWFQLHGAPQAKSRQASLPGTDVYDVPELAIEVKGTRDLDLTGALRQSAKNAKPNEYPIVIYRPAGYGPEKLSQWPVVMNMSSFIRLVHRAGLLSDVFASTKDPA